MNLYPTIAFPLALTIIGFFFFLIKRDEQEYSAIWGGRVPRWLYKKQKREYNKKIKEYEKWIRTAYNQDDLKKAIKSYERFIGGTVFVIGTGKKAIIQAFPKLEDLEVEELKEGTKLL